MTLPEAAGIDVIEVTSNFGEERPKHLITDPEQIERFVSFINSRDTGWIEPWDTFPAGLYTVAVKNEGDYVAVFWPCGAHIGGRQADQGANSNRLRPLADEEWQELKAILEIADGQEPQLR